MIKPQSQENSFRGLARKGQPGAADTAGLLPDGRRKALPDGWRCVRLGDVCTEDRRILEPESEVAAHLPYVGLEHVESGTGRILLEPSRSIAEGVRSTTFAFDSRHVLYGKLRPYLNKVALPGFAGRCTTEIIPLLPNSGVDREFLSWSLRRQETVRAAMQEKTGSRMPRADMRSLLASEIPVPPLAEQKRIAAILNEQMAAVERARSAAEAELEAAKALPAAHLRAVFRGPAVMRWPGKRVGDLCEIIGGNSLPPAKERTDEDGVYCLKVSDLAGPFSDGRSLWAGALCAASDLTGTRVLQPGAVVFPKRGGAIATNAKRLITVRAVLDPNLMGIQPIGSEELSSWYLYWWLRSWDLSSLQSGNTVPQINRKDLAPLRISLPPLSEQQRIVAMLTEQMATAERTRQALEEQLGTIGKLPAALLRRAFQGEL